MKKKINIQFIGISIIGILATMLLITNIFYELFEKELLNDIRIDLEIIKNTKIELKFNNSVTRSAIYNLNIYIFNFIF